MTEKGEVPVEAEQRRSYNDAVLLASKMERPHTAASLEPPEGASPADT